MSRLLDAALKYASRGLRVFPCAARAKNPLTRHGCHDASSDSAHIRAWWHRYPAANIGLATGVGSGLVVLDFDRKDGRAGLDTRASLHRQFRYRTLTASTPSGGLHEFFCYPGPVFRNTVNRLPGVDIRTDGGYVVIAPSMVDGQPYRWTDVVSPVDLPPDLVTMLKPPLQSSVPRTYAMPADRAAVFERVRRYVAMIPPAIEGQGGDLHTFQVACRVVRGFGLTPSEALEVMWPWNRSCQPPWSECELLAKIAGAAKYGTEPVGGRLEGGR